MHVLPRSSAGRSTRDRETASGIAPEIVLLILTVLGAILFIALRVMTGTS